jgi:tRNA threonylcarbamoyladenosine biosynthesis protein TsaB
MPIILAIDTATSVCSIALGSSDESLIELSLKSQRRHNEILPGMVEDIISGSVFKTGDIDTIAVSIGPGSFTGLRVGLAWAKGFALGLNATIIPVETLDGLAVKMIFSLKSGDVKKNKQSYSICPLVPARKGESFGKVYLCSGEEIISHSEALLFNTQELVDTLPKGCYIAGEGADSLYKELEENLGERLLTLENTDQVMSSESSLINYIPDFSASAICIGQLALKKLKDKTESIPPLEELEPLYLKEFTVRLK